MAINWTNTRTTWIIMFQYFWRHIKLWCSGIGGGSSIGFSFLKRFIKSFINLLYCCVGSFYGFLITGRVTKLTVSFGYVFFDIHNNCPSLLALVMIISSLFPSCFSASSSPFVIFCFCRFCGSFSRK